MRGTGRVAAVAAVALAAVLMAACGGEDRPSVDVIDDGTPSGSGSSSVSASGGGPTSGTGDLYAPVSNVDSYLSMAADLRDIRAILAPATAGNAVDWAAASAIYENGKNQERPEGLRSLASMPNEAVHAVFPNGAAVYGEADFINAIVRGGLNGNGRGAGVSDNARRQLVDKGIQMLLYAKVLQEIESARMRVAEGNTDDASGAPHAVDEAWGAIAGVAEADGSRPYGLLSTASSREANFGLDGKLRLPLEEALVGAQAAARAGDLDAFNAAAAAVRGHLNATFYLASLRYATSLLGDETAADREVHLAEGWTFFQTIRAQVASGATGAAETVAAAYSREPAAPYPTSERDAVYAALNEIAVLAALAIPDDLIVRNPPQ